MRHSFYIYLILSDFENRVLLVDGIKPITCVLLVGDVYTIARDEEHLLKNKKRIQSNSALTFIHDLTFNNTSP